MECAKIFVLISMRGHEKTAYDAPCLILDWNCINHDSHLLQFLFSYVRYKECCIACALEKDLEGFESGDLTEVFDDPKSFYHTIWSSNHVVFVAFYQIQRSIHASEAFEGISYLKANKPSFWDSLHSNVVCLAVHFSSRLFFHLSCLYFCSQLLEGIQSRLSSNQINSNQTFSNI